MSSVWRCKDGDNCHFFVAESVEECRGNFLRLVEAHYSSLDKDRAIERPFNCQELSPDDRCSLVSEPGEERQYYSCRELVCMAMRDEIHIEYGAISSTSWEAGDE